MSSSYETIHTAYYDTIKDAINKNEIKYIPLSPELCEKINLVYNEEIFDMNIFNLSFV